MSIINTHFPCYSTQPGARAQVCVALTSDERGLYAAYIGIVKDAVTEAERMAAAEWVSARGSKLRWKDAITHFPQIPESKYRA